MKLEFLAPLMAAALLWAPGCARKTQANSASPSNRAQLSDMSTILLGYTNGALENVREDKKQPARVQLAQALDEANRIEKAAGGKHLIPIYKEIETVSVFGPVRVLGKAGDKKPPESVTGVAGEVTNITLNLDDAKANLQAADKALNDNNLTEARKDLNNVQYAFYGESIEADLPLARARENLIMARNEAKSGDWKDARTSLQSAADALNNYASAPALPHAKDATDLKQQIDSYARSTDTKPNDAAAKIQGWWERTTDWITPPTNRPANGG